MKPFAWFWSQAREDADVAEEAAETEEADRRELELGIPREQWPKGVEGSLNKGLVADDGSGAASPESFCAASAASQQPAAAYPPTSPGKGRRASSTYAVELTKTPMGFGITLTADGTVTEIKRGSQAARSGRIKLGDRLAAVNGEAPTKATPPASLLAQQGLHGSTVKLELIPDADADPDPAIQAAATAAAALAAATSPGKGRRASSTYAVELTKTPMGFGITLTADGTVTEIKRGSQAARSGRIKLGDRLAAVNGEAPTKATPPASLLAQQGLHGSTVKLELIPDADADPDPAIQAAATAAAALAAAELAAAAAPAPTGGAAVKADADPYDPYESEVAAEKLKSEDPYESEVNEESGPTSKSASQDATPPLQPEPEPEPET